MMDHYDTTTPPSSLGKKNKKKKPTKKKKKKRKEKKKKKKKRHNKVQKIKCLKYSSTMFGLIPINFLYLNYLIEGGD